MLLLAALAPLLSACGGNGQLSVLLGYTSQDLARGQYTPGASAVMIVKVVNNGPGDARGVLVTVDMPDTFHYEETGRVQTFGGTGVVETQPLDAKVGSSDPTWGYWDLGSPTSGDKPSRATLAITFTVQVMGNPGSFDLTPRAESDTSGGGIMGRAVTAVIHPAPSLVMSAQVTPATPIADQTVTYTVTVSNTGSAAASGLSLLIALPPVTTYVRTNLPYGGNSSEGTVTTPLPGSVELFYSGFTVPAASHAGPGFLALSFVARVIRQPVSGSYGLNAQVRDDGGDVAYLTNAAMLTIASAAYTPGPVLTPSPG